MTTTDRPDPNRVDAAFAYAEMMEAVEAGYLETAISLSQTCSVPLDAVWAPADDDLIDAPRRR